MSRQSVGAWEVLSGSLSRLDWKCIARNIRKEMHQQTASLWKAVAGLEGFT